MRAVISVLRVCATKLWRKAVDIYGEYDTLIICGAYEGNLEEIAKALNGFLFKQDDGFRAN